MAFNFNWSPLIADTVRARELLTTALNKSPKPPIIVDDIVVTELNLGKVPPDLEILEIGDLADDRFRGIFKMTYAGDAFLTLKTRVQANPLNTYLSTKPSFTSPQPLAAASGLTIPLQITLSDIRLSGFVILVFSKQKGLTLVFRNDPLESLKVSSTFDSIPFVRDYLQREIEGQLRLLFMEDLPAILHKLSLRLWSPDYCPDLIVPDPDDSSVPVDPLASPLQDPVESMETSFNDDSIPSMSLEGTQDAYISFSQKNLQQLSTLSDAQQTLSVATPAISEAVYRAWASFSDRGSGIHTPSMPSISRANSSYSTSTYSLASGTYSEPTRPTLSTASSYTYSRSTGTGGGRRKKKHRVIDLRRPKVVVEPIADTVESTTVSTTPEPSIAPSSAPSVILGSIPEEPANSSKLSLLPSETVQPSPSANRSLSKQPFVEAVDESNPPPAYTPPSAEPHTYFTTSRTQSKPSASSDIKRQPIHLKTQSTSALPLLRSLSADRLSPNSISGYTSSGGILEQAWMRKIASEIARKVDEERARSDKGCDAMSGNMDSASSSAGDVDAPPAYVS
jgi:mitochondrial distribution and morphology protein 34